VNRDEIVWCEAIVRLVDGGDVNIKISSASLFLGEER
jgi:hypothetical protein